MSAKDPFQILADELTLIRKDMDQLQRTSLDKKDAQALHKKLAEGVDRMHRAASEVHQAIDNRLVTVAAYLKEEATKEKQGERNLRERRAGASELPEAQGTRQCIEHTTLWAKTF